MTHISFILVAFLLLAFICYDPRGYATCIFTSFSNHQREPSKLTPTLVLQYKANCCTNDLIYPTVREVELIFDWGRLEFRKLD
jgi:hypothetical protein